MMDLLKKIAIGIGGLFALVFGVFTMFSRAKDNELAEDIKDVDIQDARLDEQIKHIKEDITVGESELNELESKEVVAEDKSDDEIVDYWKK